MGKGGALPIEACEVNGCLGFRGTQRAEDVPSGAGSVALDTGDDYAASAEPPPLFVIAWPRNPRNRLLGKAL